MKIYIVRHGETIGNKKGLFQGSLDLDLTELGIKLALITGDGLKDINFNKVYCSPLKRAQDTANLIMKNNKYQTPITIIDDIREVNMGDWEGACFKDFSSSLDFEDVKLFRENPFMLNRFPNGESIKEVCDRTQRFLKNIVKENDENILIVTHGLALRAMLNFLYENKEDFWQGHVPYNCCVNILEYKNNEFKFIEKDKIYYSNDMIIDRYKL